MTKYPFTSEGCLALQTELYALNNLELQQEADMLLADFIFWVEAHFDLSPAQVEYLNRLNQALISFMAGNTSLALANRLPIYLIKTPRLYMGSDPEPDPDPDDDGKLIRPKPNLTVTGNNQGGVDVEGDMEINIYYIS